jgi:hypothetical protein
MNKTNNLQNNLNNFYQHINSKLHLLFMKKPNSEYKLNDYSKDITYMIHYILLICLNHSLRIPMKLYCSILRIGLHYLRAYRNRNILLDIESSYHFLKHMENCHYINIYFILENIHRSI